MTLRRRPTTGSIGELGVKELANCHGQRFEPTNDSIAPLPTIAGTIVLLGWLKILEELGLSLPIAFFVSGVLDFTVTYWVIGCAVFSLIVGGVVMILKVVGRHN